MSLHRSIRQEITVAMKNKEVDRLKAIRAILAELTNELVRQKQKPQEELPDETVLAVINKLVKQRRDSITQYQQAGREELVAEERSELEILETYLPRQLSYAEIKEKAAQKQRELALTDPKEKGRLIGVLMKELKGQADGGEVNRAVDELLSGS